MTDLATMLTALRRPKILIRAARAGVVDYRRDRDLKRLLRQRAAPRRPRRSAACSPRRSRLEDTRTAGEATYNIQRHVAVLTAILAEARLLPPPRRRPDRRRDRTFGLPRGVRTCHSASPRSSLPS